MRKKLSCTPIALSLTCCACTSPVKQEPEEPLTILFAGDSITDSGRDKEQIAPGMNLGNGYVKMVDDHYRKTKEENAPIIMNAGVNGNTSEQLVARFKTDVDVHSPDILVMLIGINDYGNRASGAASCAPENYGRQIERIMHDYAYAYYRVILITPFLIEDAGTERRIQLKEYQDILRDIVAEYDNVELLDAQAVFDDAISKPDYSPAEYTPDQVHLYQKAAQDLTDAVIHTLALN